MSGQSAKNRTMISRPRKRWFPVVLMICVSALAAGVRNTGWAQPVEEGSPAAAAMTERVDQLLERRLTELGWQPAGDSSDAAFVRRAYLDLTGWPPSASQALAFIQDEDPGKHDRLVEKLLASPLSASHLAHQWSQWMLPEDNSGLLGGGRESLRTWLRNRFSENLRYDRLVADLMVASGPVQAGPTEFFVALEGKPEKIAAKTARVFMGVQLIVRSATTILSTNGPSEIFGDLQPTLHVCRPVVSWLWVAAPKSRTLMAARLPCPEVTRLFLRSPWWKPA